MVAFHGRIILVVSIPPTKRSAQVEKPMLMPPEPVRCQVGISKPQQQPFCAIFKSNIPIKARCVAVFAVRHCHGAVRFRIFGALRTAVAFEIAPGSLALELECGLLFVFLSV